MSKLWYITFLETFCYKLSFVIYATFNNNNNNNNNTIRRNAKKCDPISTFRLNTAIMKGFPFTVLMLCGKKSNDVMLADIFSETMY